MDQAKYNFTEHASKQAQRRGVRPGVIGFILHYADVDLEAGKGCRTHRISKKAAADLRRKGIAVKEVDRAMNVVVLVAEGSIVTVMHDLKKHGRKYRRQWPTWKRSSKRYSRAA